MQQEATRCFHPDRSQLMASPTQIGPDAHLDSRPPASMRFFALAIGAGLLFTLLAAVIFMHLPAARVPRSPALCLRALAFVVVAALAGTFGSWYYWKNSASPLRANPPASFASVALAGAAGWVWVPAIVLLSREDSPLTAVIATLAAALFSFALRKAIPSGDALHPSALIADAEPRLPLRRDAAQAAAPVPRIHPRRHPLSCRLRVL